MTGKFTPIAQWFAFSDVGVLPAWATVPIPGQTAALEAVPLPAADCAAADEFEPRGARDDALVAIFGRRFQAQVSRQART